MKIIIDIDGTLTDFNSFVDTVAVAWFKKKYGIAPVRPDMFDVEDVFDLEAVCGQGLLNGKSKKEILDEFWVSHRFIQYTLLARFRKGSASLFQYLSKKGFEIEVCTSRQRTVDKNAVGLIARVCTGLQFVRNGIFLKVGSLLYFTDDKEKLKYIKECDPVVVFDDKPEIIEELIRAGIHVICVNGRHNQSVDEGEFCVRTDNLEPCTVVEALEIVFGTENLRCIEQEADSSRFFKKLLFTGAIIQKKYSVTVLNPENNIVNSHRGGVLVAPNHIRTPDPLVIESILRTNVHWVVLKRFMEAKDSIFDNSKNPILCQVTKYVFSRLHFFPVERKSDNNEADNFTEILNMHRFLKNGFRVGIFPEGTTRKKTGEFFGNFDKMFVLLAKKSKALIQPVTMYWFGDRRKNVIINFGEAIETDKVSVNEIFEKYLLAQQNGYEECKKYADDAI